MKKQRLVYIDLAKGLCILCVIIHHCYVELGIAWPADSYFSLFRMPLYFCLSGAFFKEYDGFIGFIIRKINKLIVPFVSFFLITSVFLPLVLSWCFSYSWINSDFSLLYSWIGDRTTLFNGSLWFLLCLFEMNLIFYLINCLAKQTKYYLFMLIFYSLSIGSLGYIIHSFGFFIPLYIDSALTCIPFFCFGFVLYRYTNIFQQDVPIDRFLLLFAFVLLLIPIYFKGRADYYCNDIGPLFSVFISGICGALGILALTKRISYIPCISYIGHYSIIPLCLNSVILHILKPFFFSLSFGLILKIIALFMVTVSVCMACIPFFIKYTPWIVAQKNVINVNS